MTADRWAEVAAIVEDVLAQLPESRLAFVRQACQNDAALEGQVVALLSHHQDEEDIRASATATASVNLPSPGTPASFTHERFERLEWVGAGGFGTVYKAYDRHFRRWVALKALGGADPIRLDRFKQEFRKTASITHPNIVRLHELFSDGKQWFFTMELIDGVSILDYIQGPRPQAGVLSPGGWRRLRGAFTQLVEGVSALHAAGVVHGDIKPSNVLVTPQGRVVLLDFSLVRDIAAQPSLLAGTPAYMAPEQLTRAAVAESADWYSLGMLLYEALTATVPFAGTFWEISIRKQCEDVRLPPGHDLPDAIIQLCESLLDRQPDRRPSAPEILERMAAPHPKGAPALPPETPRVFVGRGRALETLRTAFEQVLQGRAAAVHIHGPSGIGKSALVRQFLGSIRREQGEDAVVLEGRCYQAESVPFKALDELVDDLARHLGSLELSDIAALIPRDMALLMRVFPALQRVPGAKGSARLVADQTSAQELRDRALAALEELLERLAVRRRVVLWIDDLQWGDLDSVRVLRDLQRPSSAPALLLILSYRDDAIQASAVLNAVTDGAVEGAQAGAIHTLPLGALPPDEAHELAAALCGALPTAVHAAMVNEAAGNPLFLHELARHLESSSQATERMPTLIEMVQQRIDMLGRSARRLLGIIAVAGQPVERDVALDAAGLEDAHAESMLLADLLVRASKLSPSGELDTYHDKIREAVLGLMSADERRRHHGALARALEAGGHADPERLVHHFINAGIEGEAYWCAVRAARAADEGLAFDQAASLFRLAVDLHPRVADPKSVGVSDDPGLLALIRHLARALANAGRSAEAAQAYLRASTLVKGDEHNELRSLAVDQLMRSGQINDGLALLTAVLREHGMRVPRRRGALLAAAVATRLLIRARGLSAQERPAHDVPPTLLKNIDRLWTAGATLTGIDPMLAAYIRGRHLLRALRAGEPSRLAVGLALEAVQRVMTRGHSYPMARQILDRAREMASQSGEPYAEAMVMTAEAGVAYFSGRMIDAFRFGVQGEEMLVSRRTGVAWELAATRVWILSALVFSGQWKEYRRRSSAMLHEATRNGDRYGQYALPLLTGCYVGDLAADDPAGARRMLDEKLAHWGRPEMDVPRLSHFYGSVEVLLYEHRYEEAWQLLSTTWPLIERTFAFRIEFFRLMAGRLRARCAVALGSATRQPAVLSIARQFVPESARAKSTLMQGCGLLIDASLAASDGRRESAIAKLQLAEERLEDAGAMHLIAASRFRRGGLMGGAAGAALIRLAESELLEIGAASPQRMTERLIPGVF